MCNEKAGGLEGKGYGHCFVIGRQRSGTTVFRKLLAVSAYCWDVGEIFHSAPMPLPERYFNFREKKIKQSIEYSHPGYDERIFLWFIDFLESKYPNTNLIFDVKYIDLHYIMDRSKSMAFEPFLVRYMQEKEVPVFHVIRKNKLRLLVSERMAQQSGVWEVWTKGVPAVEAVWLDSGRIQEDIAEEIRYTNYVREKFCSLSKYKEIFYEEMFSECGEFSPKLIDSVRRSTGLDFSRESPDLHKQGVRPLADSIANYDQIKAALEGTSCEWMLYD